MLLISVSASGYLSHYYWAFWYLNHVLIQSSLKTCRTLSSSVLLNVKKNVCILKQHSIKDRVLKRLLSLKPASVLKCFMLATVPSSPIPALQNTAFWMPPPLLPYNKVVLIFFDKIYQLLISKLEQIPCWSCWNLVWRIEHAVKSSLTSHLWVTFASQFSNFAHIDYF